MAISMWSNPAKLPPIDFDFLLKTKQLREAKEDAASEVLDKTQGLLAALNPAPGNEDWAKRVSNDYQTVMSKITDDFGKVPIQQTISDVRKLKSHFINNPEVKTILNNKEYFDKILAPYMANKEAQLNVPGGTMQNYLEPVEGGGYKFKPNELSYSGTLSYQPFADYNKRNFDYLKEVVSRLIPKDSNGNLVPTTTDEYGNLYWVDNNQKRYVKDDKTFQTAVEGLANTTLSQSDPESRWYKADLEFHGQGDLFNKENIKNHLLELSKPLWGEDIKGDESVHPLSTSVNGSSRGRSKITPEQAITSSGTINAAIIGSPDEADYTLAKQKDVIPNEQVIANNFAEAQSNNTMLSNFQVTDPNKPNYLHIDRTFEPKKGYTYNLGMSRDEFVNNYSGGDPGLAEQLKHTYDDLSSSLNNKSLQENNQYTLLKQAEDEAAKSTLIVGNRDYRAYVNAVENYSYMPAPTQEAINRQISGVLDSYVQSLHYDNPAANPSINAIDPAKEVARIDAVLQPEYKKKKQEILQEIQTTGAIPKDFQNYLIRNKFAQDKVSYANYEKYKDKAVEIYRSKYENDQLKDYNIYNFDPDNVPEGDKGALARIQGSLATGLKSTKDQFGGIVPGKNADNYEYYLPSDITKEGIESGKIPAPNLFGKDGDYVGVDVSGYIFDPQDGWFAVGKLQPKTGKSGVAESSAPNILIKSKTADKEITEAITNDPNVSNIADVLRSVIVNNTATNNVVTPSYEPAQKLFTALGMENVYINNAPNPSGQPNEIFMSFKPKNDDIWKAYEESTGQKVPKNQKSNFITVTKSNLIDLASYISNYVTYRNQVLGSLGKK